MQQYEDCRHRAGRACVDARVQRVSVKSALPTNLTYIGHCLGQVESVTYIGGEICGSRPEAALQAFSLGHVEELHKYEACFQVWEFCFQKKQPISENSSIRSPYCLLGVSRRSREWRLRGPSPHHGAGEAVEATSCVYLRHRTTSSAAAE